MITVRKFDFGVPLRESYLALDLFGINFRLSMPAETY